MGLYCTLLWFDNMWSFSNISLHIMIAFCSCLNPTDIARDYIDSKNNSTKAGRATDWLPAEQVFANTAIGSTSYSGVSCFDCSEE